MKMKITTLILLLTSFSASATVFESNVSGGSGSWSSGASWIQISGPVDTDNIPDNGDDVTILSGDEIINTSTSYVRHLEIEAGAILRGGSSSYGILRIYGNLINSGSILQRQLFALYTNGTSISGTGTWSASSRISSYGNISINANVTLSISSPGTINILSNKTLSNYGNLTTYELVGFNSASRLNNYGQLVITGTNFLTTGILDASYAGNKVTYTNTTGGTRNVKQVFSSYYDLTLSHSGACTYHLTGNVIVQNDFSVSGNPTLNMNNYNLTVGDDFSVNNITNDGDFTFNGSGTQVISASGSLNPLVLEGDVTVNVGSTTTLNKALRVTGNFTNSGTFDVTASNFALTLQGSTFTNNGTFTPQNGTVTFSGSVAQNINGTSEAEFYNITLSNANGLTMDSPVLVNRAVSSTSGSYNANGNLTLNSTAALDAFITANTTVSGNMTVRRYIGGGSADYRDIAPPVAGAEATQWDDDFIISGPLFPDGCAYSGSGCYKSLMRYNASSQVYKKFSRPDTAITRGLGYEIFLGDDLNVFSGAVADVTGTYAFTTNSATLTARTSWNLVGNPFPSAIDFDLCTKGGGIGNYFYIYDPTTGNYEWYDGASSTSSGNVSSVGHISSGQGFWLYNSGGVNFLTVPQAAKITTTPVFVRSPRNAVSGTLSLVLSSNTTDAICRSVVDFTALTRDMAREDIQMLRVPLHPEVTSTPPTMAFVNESGELTRKDLRLEEDRVEIPVMYNAFKAGQYTITAELIDAFDTYSCVQLLDNKTGEYTDLRREYYTFTSEGDGKDETRFTLIVSKDGDCRSQEPVAVSLADFVSVRNFGNTITVMVDNYPDMLEGTLTLYNSLGQIVNEPTRVLAQPYTYELFLPSDARGVYMIVVDFGTEKVVKKIVY
jgi:hypothetical protein